MPALAKKSLARRPLVIAAVNDYLQRKADRMRAQKKNSQQSLVHANTRHQPERLSELNVNGLHPSSAGSVRSNGYVMFSLYVSCRFIILIFCVNGH